MANTLQNPNSEISAYYQTRVTHHDIVANNWLTQAQATVDRHPDVNGFQPSRIKDCKSFLTSSEFDSW